MRINALTRDQRSTTAETCLEVDGASLRVRDEGQGSAVLLIHGWALDLDMWQPQVAAWSGRLRLVRFDRRGFGASSGQPSLVADAQDVEALLRRFELPHVVLIGMSQGARVAMRVAVGPLAARVAGLVLDGAPYEVAGDGESEVPMTRYRELARSQGLAAVRAEWRRHPFMQLATRDADTHALLERMTAQYPGIDLLASPPADDVPLQAAAIDVATLVVNGAHDTPQRRAMGEALALALPRAERAMITHAGHLPNLDNPAEYDRQILPFIERVAARRPAGGP